MTEHRVPDEVYITSEEHMRLRYTSESSGQPLRVIFNRRRVWLEQTELNAWAFALLVEWRGVPE